MTYKRTVKIIVVILLAFQAGTAWSDEPVNPDATPEARALLSYIQGISGRLILSGQHNFPLSGSRNSEFVTNYIGKTPVVWSQDFGFAGDGDKDSYLARPAIIQEAIRQHKLGSIITMCWHAVPPTADEPITFQPVQGADPAAPLASVQGRLSDKQFRDILTPGTSLYKKWVKQVDIIASFLKQLQDAKVPVLWRPYHEMNGDWFWWGGRHEGKYTTAALYRQLYNRFTKVHKLNNLIWVWSVDRPSRPDREFIKYYPGSQYLDILAIDIYGNDFDQSYYEGLLALSKGKPLTLGEVGNPPSPEIIEKQPGWVYWVVWSGMVRSTPFADYQRLIDNSRVVFMEDREFTEGSRDYRQVCGFEPVKFNVSADFTGEWRLNECESVLAGGGSFPPYKLDISQKDNKLSVMSASLVEWDDDQITEETLTLDGKDNNSVAFMNSPRVQNALWSAEKDTLTIDSRITSNFSGRVSELKSKETWTLQRNGKKLVIIQTSDTFFGRGRNTSKIVYDKR